MQTTTKKKRPIYTTKFKQDAANLVLKSNYTHKEAAKNLGISLSALQRWVRFENNSNRKLPNLTDNAELIKLRKELARVTMEREILKKAMVFFAKEGA